mmetsp:Transcript_10553/g.28172  ORF Transcript_10553/g.28172 Transcript_10553/m.28172 type:complete len:461 (-) Transcript_10553:7-1389(-)
MRSWDPLQLDAELEQRVQRVVVAAPRSKIPRGDDIVAAAVDVIDSTERPPAVDLVQTVGQRVHHGRVETGVEIADNHDHVPRGGTRSNELHDVERGSLAAAQATGVHGQGAVVDHEEEVHARDAVAEANPHPRASAVPLVRTVFGDVLVVPADRVPRVPAVRDGHRMRAGHAHELVLKTAVAQHAIDVLALLEAHDVVRVALVPARDEPSGAAAGAAPAPEEVPPEEVVRQDLHLRPRAAPAAVEVPVVARSLGAAPPALGEDLAHRLPSNHHVLHRELPPRGCAAPVHGPVARLGRQRQHPARQRAVGEAVPVQHCLELLEGRALGQTGVPLGVLLDAGLHRPRHVAVARLARLHVAAGGSVRRLVGLCAPRRCRCGLSDGEVFLVAGRARAERRQRGAGQEAEADGDCCNDVSSGGLAGSRLRGRTLAPHLHNRRAGGRRTLHGCGLHGSPFWVLAEA